MRQPALDRALAIYRYARSRTRHKGAGGEIKIVAVMTVSGSGRNLVPGLGDQASEQEAHLAVVIKHKVWLDGFMRLYAADIDSADLEQQVFWSKNPGTDLAALASEKGCDIIIKTADAHGMLDAVFTPPDLQLLRHTAVPVFIARDHIWEPTGVIAVAVDISDPADRSSRLLNMWLLREAQELAKFTGCSIHLINAIQPLIPSVAANAPSYALPLGGGEEALKESCKQVLAFAARHRIPPEHCHLREGHPDKVIPALCRELKPTALFIGSSGRTGIAVALLGGICERVMDVVECDLAVIPPRVAPLHERRRN